MPSRQQGMTLLELLISLALSLMLLAGIISIYISTKSSFLTQESVNRRQENLRFAIDLIERDLRMAGYRGCLKDNGQVRNTLNTPGNFLYDFDKPVQGFDAQSGAWQPALDASIAGALPGSDVITLRTISDPEVYVTQEMPNTSADLKTNDGHSPAPFATGGGDIVMITDCGGAAIFQITQYTVANGNIVHNAGNGSGLPTPGNATKDLGRRYPVGSLIFKLNTTSYYVANATNGSGPALWRRVQSGAAQELAYGVSNMQVLYGEDTNADSSPDAFRTADAVANWRSVVSIRVALLTASLDTPLADADSRTFDLLGQSLGPYDDRRLRRVVTTTIALRNRLP